MKRLWLTFGICVLALTTMIDNINSQHRYGILGQKAPEWGVSNWFNLENGTEKLDVSDFKGKVVYLYGFQSWCPGCHSHGFPTLQQVEKHFKENENVVFVAVQTVFEGFESNTIDKAVKTVQEFKLDIPVGHDSGRNGSGSALMRRYRSGGTPWTVIIDREGFVQFNDFSIKPDKAVALIDRLLVPETEG